MKVLTKAVLPDGTNVQIEDWSEDYSFYPYGHTLATYPVSKATIKGSFAPKLDKKFRFALDFESHSEASEALENLVSGTKQLIDYKDNFKGNKEELKCITGYALV